MKTRPLTRVLLLVLALALTVNTAALGAVIYDNTRPVSDTLTYGNTAFSNGNGRQESYYLSYSPGGDIRPVVSAGASVYGGSTIDSVVSHVESQGYNVVGGINADFFSLQTGIMEGIYISDGRLLSSHHGKSIVAFREDGSAFVTDTELVFTLTNQGGAGTGNSGKTVNVLFYNKYRQPGYLFLMDENYSSTTRTSSAGKEVYFRVLSGQVAVNSSVELEVVNVANSAGAVNIPEGQIVLTADAACPYYSELSKFDVGDRVTLRASSGDSGLTQAVWATGGGDVLVSGGGKTSGWDSSISGVNPRSAIGIKPDGTVLLYALDGRNASHSVGLTLGELADELIALGCTQVVNLDGGGSTSFSFRYPGTTGVSVINSPSDGGLRSCATYILLTGTNPTGGEAAYLHFTPFNQVTVLGGSGVTPEDLADITATDSGYFAAAVPAGGFSYSADSALGQTEGALFRTARADASGTLTVYAAGGAKGWLNLRVVASPDSIGLTAGGETLDTLYLAAGDQIQLTPVAAHGGDTIVSTLDAYTFTATGGAAEVDSRGTVTASGGAGSSGTVSVSAGNVTKSIELIVARLFADTDGHWAEAAIGLMKAAGVVNGYDTPLGTYFYPDQNVTRAEFAAMLTRLLGIDETQYSLSGSEFLDNDSIPDWVRPYAAVMYESGYMNGRAADGGANFDANDPITRAEAFTMLGRIMEVEASTDALDRFVDAGDIPDWARGDIAKLVEAGMLTGYSDGTLLPLNNINRAEAAAILSRLDLDLLLPEGVGPEESGLDSALDSEVA